MKTAQQRSHRVHGPQRPSVDGRTGRTTAAPTPDEAQAGPLELDPVNTKELRLGLVCYGGVSLAIYMHGMTKEIHKLVLASAEFGKDPVNNPYRPDEVGYAYWNALQRRMTTVDRGVRTRVVVDVIAGSSAGGINGIVLAKALAANCSMDPLRDLWLNDGDINKLLNVRVPTLPGKLAYWFVVRQLLPKLPYLRVDAKPPLDGDLMFKLIDTALKTMDQTPAHRTAAADRAQRRSLIPDGHLLELFVTTTDVNGYDRLVYLFDPQQVRDAAHRHVLRFRYGPGVRNNFTAEHNGVLAFAARATSSFPGAFSPINLGNISDNLPHWKLPSLEPEFFAIYKACGADPMKTFFIDGGVLDNYPFQPAIEAITRKTAAYEVDRRLIFLEPDPAGPLPDATGQAPSWLSTIWAGLSRLPREEPILDDLLTVRAYNDRIRQIQTIVRSAGERVEREIINAAGDAKTLSDAAQKARDRWRGDMTEHAAEVCGPAYDVYARVKLRAVVETFADVAAQLAGYPSDSNQALFIQDVLLAWARQQQAILGDERLVELNDAQKAFLKAFDLGYTQRCIRFVIQGINNLYAQAEDDDEKPNRVDLNAAKRELYARYSQIAELIAGAGTDELRPAVEQIFSQKKVEDVLNSSVDASQAVRTFVTQEGAAISALQVELRKFLEGKLGALRTSLWTFITDCVRDWKQSAADAVLVRYLGFPLWDALVYPMRKLGDVGEMQAIDVVRMSPNDARLLSPDGRNKLKGVALFHFGAFFHRQARENDYLWGRLDAAECLLRLVSGERDAPFAKEAFHAILSEEETALPTVGGLMDDLAHRVAALPDTPLAAMPRASARA